MFDAIKANTKKYVSDTFPFQSVQITEIPFVSEMADEDIISAFIQLDNFPSWTNELHYGDKESFDMLGIPFENKYFKFGDLRLLDRSTLIGYFETFTNDHYKGYWIDDEDYLKLFGDIKDVLQKVDKIYFADVDNFKSRNQAKLRRHQADAYDYYFLMLWVDKSNRLLTICEWSYD